jgi:hypothetical protein
MKTFLFQVFFTAFFCLNAYASKSDYTLFHPTPEKEMRKFRTERPDKTRTAYTIDAGHVQLESELLTFLNSAETKGVEALLGNFRIGLTNKTELQFQVGTYISEKEKHGRDTQWRNGFGNITTRFKYNLLGNDSGRFAAAIMPFVTLPTAGAGLGPDKAKYGFVIPLDYALSDTWRTGMMLGMNQSSQSRNSSEYVGSASLSHLFFEKLWVYGELYHSRRDVSETQQITTADFVFQYEFTEKFNMDLGTFLGLTEASEKQVYFVGATWLF